ncbi:hypothetical protein JAAARDRAFT_203689 [Jaapia argillacea MUCL 33604]|uniref:Uncharacterized protein n=1 Tax=Jaapia argillacea MUCL 33604 TaxID=933084 RepID=A0A067QGF1_9AGAM|nr:hypothetical protein JAAARDRAFT_203689 [Jaapia argillacea MUCL 33604]
MSHQARHIEDSQVEEELVDSAKLRLPVVGLGIRSVKGRPRGKGDSLRRGASRRTRQTARKSTGIPREVGASEDAFPTSDAKELDGETSSGEASVSKRTQDPSSERSTKTRKRPKETDQSEKDIGSPSRRTRRSARLLGAETSVGVPADQQQGPSGGSSAESAEPTANHDRVKDGNLENAHPGRERDSYELEKNSRST